MIIVQLINHYDKKRIRVDARNEYDFRLKIKRVEGRRWSATKTCWHIPYEKKAYQHLQTLFGKQNIQVIQPIQERSLSIKQSEASLNAYQQKAILALEEQLILEGKNWRTIKIYRRHLKEFFLYYSQLHPFQISNRQIKQYILHKIQKDKINEVTQNQLINAIDTYYTQMLGQNLRLGKLRDRKITKNKPTTLSKKEVVDLFKSLQNTKHKTMLALVYAASLDENAIINLRRKDINLQSKSLFIQGQKGEDDCYVLLSNKLMDLLQSYLSIYNPRYWLFEGQRGGQYSGQSLLSLFKKAKELADVNPLVTLQEFSESKS